MFYDGTHCVYLAGIMKDLSQQELLQALKGTMSTTWNGVSERTGIAPRTIKSYLLPDDSKGRRGMDKFVREAVEKALLQEQKKVKKSA